MEARKIQSGLEAFLRSGDAFSRKDDTDDCVFYARDRFVSHLDAVALSTVEKTIGSLVVEPRPVVLDLMAGWDSHLPRTLVPDEVVGLGMNPSELDRNSALDRWVMHDLNRDPHLPFEDAVFDVVINTVSVDYMTQPFDVFREVGRVLKPGGLFLVIFSNRLFPEKAVKIWRESSENERVMLVEDYFLAAGCFEAPKTFVSKGRPRPQDDKHAHTGLPSDPVYAVYAERFGGAPRSVERPLPELETSAGPPPEELEARRARVGETLECPHCGTRMKKWSVPDSPFNIWDTEFMYICFNDACPYLVRGWEVMNRQGNAGVSYRQMYNPQNGCLSPIPVPHLRALRDGIVEEA